MEREKEFQIWDTSNDEQKNAIYLTPLMLDLTLVSSRWSVVYSIRRKDLLWILSSLSRTMFTLLNLFIFTTCTNSWFVFLCLSGILSINFHGWSTIGIRAVIDSINCLITLEFTLNEPKHSFRRKRKWMERFCACLHPEVRAIPASLSKGWYFHDLFICQVIKQSDFTKTTERL